MTRASVEQAAATRSIAIDSKRDAEIMKVITVVTLFYLPATFVTVGSSLLMLSELVLIIVLYRPSLGWEFFTGTLIMQADD